MFVRGVVTVVLSGRVAVVALGCGTVVCAGFAALLRTEVAALLLTLVPVALFAGVVVVLRTWVPLVLLADTDGAVLLLVTSAERPVLVVAVRVAEALRSLTDVRVSVVARVLAALFVPTVVDSLLSRLLTDGWVARVLAY